MEYFVTANTLRLLKACNFFSFCFPILSKMYCFNHLGGGPVVKVWDQEICSLCDLRFELCGCSYDGTRGLHGR